MMDETLSKFEVRLVIFLHGFYFVYKLIYYFITNCGLRQYIIYTAVESDSIINN